MSQPARSVVIFCRAAGVPHEHVGVGSSLDQSEHITNQSLCHHRLFLEYDFLHLRVQVRITAGDTKTEEYKKMNPLCKVCSTLLVFKVGPKHGYKQFLSDHLKNLIPLPMFLTKWVLLLLSRRDSEILPLMLFGLVWTYSIKLQVSILRCLY